MNDTLTHKPAIWYWFISALALLWNFGGVMAFIGQVTMKPEDIEKLTAAQQAAMVGLPTWMTAVFAIAVFAGALGCLLLLLRKSVAIWLFVISLIAVLIQQIYWWVLSDIGKSMSSQDLVMTISIPIVAIFLIWFARMAKGRGWVS